MRNSIAMIMALALTGSWGCKESGSFPSHDGGNDDSYWPTFEGGGGPPRPKCGGQEVTITGTVLAPNGIDPVPGATVFIPSKLPELFPPEVKCEVCGQLGNSYNWWQTNTNYRGQFTLKLVCPGKRALFFQNGRFRRKIDVNLKAKSTTKIAANLSRLPRRNKEFTPFDSVPRIAVATGDYDKMECVLRKMGLEQSDYFKLFEGASSLKSPKPLTPFKDLVSNLTTMKKYNIIFINCTGNTYESLLTNLQTRKNLSDYVAAGGRLYVTDWSYDWIEQVETFAPFIDYEPGVSDGKPETKNAAALGAAGLKIQATIKNSQLAQWLSLHPGAIQGGKSTIEHFLIGWVIMNKLHKDTKLWVEGSIRSTKGDIVGSRPLTVTFNFKNCGKILYSSYHTEGREDEGLFPKAFPGYCGTKFSPQDRILEYLIFDIASCVKPIE